jgi:RNA polymerase sigma factor (sigma-70 family)
LTCTDMGRRKFSREPLLTAEQETDLGRRAFAGDIQARNKLVLANERLAAHCAKRYRSTTIGKDDLEQQAMLALIEAAGRFDPEGHPGIRFSTYAHRCIKGQLQTMLEKWLRIPTQSDVDFDWIPDRHSTDHSDVDAEKVWNALKAVRPKDRSIVIGHEGLDGEGSLTFREMAAQLGCSKQRVQQRHKKAMAEFEAELRKIA